MKQSSDNHTFWGAVLLFIAVYYIIRELAADRFLITHWVRIGFFLLLALRNFLLPLWQKRSRAVMVRENDELVHLIRLKSYEAAMWASLPSLAILGVILEKWGDSEMIQYTGVVLWLSSFFILAIFRIIPALCAIVFMSGQGGKK